MRRLVDWFFPTHERALWFLYAAAFVGGLCLMECAWKSGDGWLLLAGVAVFAVALIYLLTWE